MPRKKKKKTKLIITCKKCGYSWDPKEVEPEKTWHMVSPMPDKEGRITVTLLGIWVCPQCGSKVRGVLSKVKVGGDLEKSVDRTMLLLQELKKSDRVNLGNLARKFNFSVDTIKKAIQYLIKKGEISGKIENEYFIRET